MENFKTKKQIVKDISKQKQKQKTKTTKQNKKRRKGEEENENLLGEILERNIVERAVEAECDTKKCVKRGGHARLIYITRYKS